MMLRWSTGAIILVAAMAVMPWAAADGYVMHARISYDAGSTMVKGTEDADWSHATLNTLVLPGDTLWVDKGGTAEIEFAGGAFLRMADGSKLEVTSIPPNGLVRGWDGSFYLQRLSRSTGDFALATPACKVEVEKDTAVRVDILDSGATTVTVRWGRVCVRTDAGGATNVGAGERCWVDPGLLPSTPAAFDRDLEDGLDQWNRERAKHLAAGPATTPVPVTIAEPTIGLYDLDGYGEWVTVDSRPYWRPTVVVDYVPYRYGHWTFVCGVGNVWVEDYPFAYVTCHYGRWQHLPHYGWVWGYDPVWSPAWVATVHCGDYFMWAPVDFACRPVVVHDSVFFSVGGVHFDFSVCSYVHADHLFGYPRYVCAPDHDFIGYVRHHERNINIWNININVNNNVVRVPYQHADRLVRDYHPRRAIRGPAAFDGGVAVSQRVKSLEGSLGRDRFSRVDRTGERKERTALNRDGRNPGGRSVRLEGPVQAQAPSLYAHTASLERTGRDRKAIPERGERVGNVRTDGPGERGSAGRSPRGRDMDTVPASRDNEMSGPRRTPRGGESENASTPGRTLRGPADTARIDRPPQDEGRGRVLDTPRGGRTDEPAAPSERRGGRTLERSTAREPEFTPPPVDRTPERTAPADRGGRTIERAPVGGFERSAPRMERSVPETRIERSEPAPRVERSAPRVERSVPETRIERSEPAPRVERSAPAPRIERSAPETRVERSAPPVSRGDSGGGRGSGGDHGGSVRGRH